MPITPVTLRGKEIILEPLLQAHAAELYSGACDVKRFQYLAPEATKGVAEFSRWIERRLHEVRQGTALAFMIHGKQSGRPIGSTSMINMSARHHRLEIGHTWLRREWRESKAEPEAKLLLMTHAFEEMDAVRVQFKMDARDEQGLMHMKEIGAVREGRMRNERILTDGFIRDADVFSIIREEWPEVKKALNAIVWT